MSHKRDARLIWVKDSINRAMGCLILRDPFLTFFISNVTELGAILKISKSLVLILTIVVDVLPLSSNFT